MELTFLRSSMPLSKIFNDGRVQSYPKGSEFTSNTATIASTQDLLNELQTHARYGCAIHTGRLTRPLVNESRKGAHDRQGHTKFLILDIDGLELPYQIGTQCSAIDVEKAATRIATYLPECLQNTSFVAHASSSFGLHKSTVSLHMMYMLDKALPPKIIKACLEGLNATVPYLKERLALSSSGFSLKYPLDIVVNDNGRLIYVAPPRFIGNPSNPFGNDDDRFCLVQNKNDILNTDDFIYASKANVAQRELAAVLKTLRKEAGLQAKQWKEKTTTSYEGEVTYIANPDRVTIVMNEERGDFVGYNVLGPGRSGDSGAYWCPRNDPKIMFNFKGETPFDFEKADPSAYAEHVHKFCSVDTYQSDSGEAPLVYQDIETGHWCYTLINDVEDTIALAPVDCRNNVGPIKNFLANYGLQMPEVLPLWEMTFDPRPTSRAIDRDKKLLNTFNEPKMLRNMVDLPNKYINATFGQGAYLKEICPTLHNIIACACGQDLKNKNTEGRNEFEHVINWLACIVQNRTKTRVAMVFQGIQGTGKGQLFKHILQPIFGKYAKQVRINDMRDRFNAFLDENIILNIDEFSLSRSKDKTVLENLKGIITEETQPVRRMQRVVEAMPNYTNVLIFTNQRGAIPLEESNRRFRICPYQTLPMKEQMPEFVFKSQEEQTQLCNTELPRLVTFLSKFIVDTRELININLTDANLQSFLAAQSVEEEFFYNIRVGNLDFFLDVLLEDDYKNEYVSSAKTAIIDWIRAVDGDQPSLVLNSHTMALYNTMVGFIDKAGVFGKKMRNAGIETKDIRRKNVHGTGYEIRMTTKLTEIERRELLNAEAERLRKKTGISYNISSQTHKNVD